MQPSAVCLVSGGLDSAVTLAIAREEGYRRFAISFQYGQRHQVELDAARAVCRSIGVEQHVVCPIDLRVFGGSALTDDIGVPKDRPDSEIETGVPITYVPARNTIFLSLALGWAEVLEAFDLFVGVNAVDYSGYPDCRPEFIEQFERLANLATRAGTEGRQKFRIHSPLIRLSKAEIIETGTRLGVDFGLTLSCYDPQQGRPCGRCDSCLLRARGFEQAGLTDPALTR